MKSNRNPHVIGDQVQVSAKAYPQWVIVDRAGTDEESIVNDFFTFEAAKSYVEEFSYDFEGLVIMRRREDGVLTTEY